VLGQEIAVMGITEGEFVLELLAQLPLTEVIAEALAGQLGIEQLDRVIRTIRSTAPTSWA